MEFCVSLTDGLGASQLVNSLDVSEIEYFLFSPASLDLIGIKFPRKSKEKLYTFHLYTCESYITLQSM